MRRAAVTMVFLLAAVSLPHPGSGQQEQGAPNPGREEPATKFERFLLSKGTVRVRELYPIGRLSGRGSAELTVARAYTPGAQDALLALRIEVEEIGRVARKRIGILDAEEVAALASALPPMRTLMLSLAQNPGQADTEVDFQGGSVRVGFSVTSLRRQNVFIYAGTTLGAAGSFFEPGDLKKLDDLVQRALTRMQELRHHPRW